MNKRKSGIIHTEGDDLFYKVTGNGIPLIMIPGGGGDGDSFLPLADELDGKFKVTTYDRRANARSTANKPINFSITQQSRDVLAVLNAVGEESAFVFGNSSGGVIALELVKNFPDAVRMAIIHEPPLANFANDPARWLKFFDDCYQLAVSKDSGKVATKFGMGVMGRKTIAPLLSDIRLKIYLLKEPKQAGETRLPQKLADDIFIKQELIQVTSYIPDLEALREHKDKLIFASGDWTVKNKVWFAEVAKKLSQETSSSYLARRTYFVHG
ncbi:alpha/beta fold hydrolase [Paenibacillus sp. OV219]|uniref:alpha/beta fold hydrolase n=1 Tax=Paenibacillus sp. OV219 TaxID=1884377 RepID=UPI0008D371E4|nr:alpha/beta hydrolase [Paenibacillus sp. OV219]SEN94187.1 alpha/beta hydrolase fold [Paenibacillus sp. OV219]